MIARAATETAGVLTYLTSPEKPAQIRAAIRPRKWLCSAQPVLLERDPGRARAAARAYMSFYLRIPHYATMLATVGYGPKDFADGGSDCREHMICPLPRASEMSAFAGRRATAIVNQGGDDGARRGRPGAGHEDPRGHHASVGWSHHLVAGGR